MRPGSALAPLNLCFVTVEVPPVWAHGGIRASTHRGFDKQILACILSFCFSLWVATDPLRLMRGEHWARGRW